MMKFTKKKNNLKPEDYEFIWDWEVHYILSYMHFLSGYHRIDSLIFLNGKRNSLFISNTEKKKLSKVGLKLYTFGFQKYKQKIISEIIKNKKRVKEEYKKELKKLSNRDLAVALAKMIKWAMRGISNYFFTEYHLTDGVAKILSIKDKKCDFKKIKENINEMAKLKYQQRQIYNNFIYSPSIIDEYLKEIKKRIKTRYNLYNYRPEELIDLLNGKKEKVPDRSKYVILSKLFKNKEIVGREAENIYKLFHKIDRSIKEFSGNIGNKGHYTGRVKKIEFSIKTDFVKEINIMNTGDILVSGSTGPEMILACKKAGAIIADEGGIMSHAALVSRELGIPSIIGTKIATKVLKDGDLVEVDANKGIVKILKKN